MEVNVNMSAEEFLEFMAWKRDQSNTTMKWQPGPRKWNCWPRKHAGP